MKQGFRLRKQLKTRILRINYLPHLAPDLEYCRQSLERSDSHHYLISLLMPAEKRPALWTLGAFKHVVETIPASVSDPALGYMRLTWWRDQIELLEKGGLTKGQPVLSCIKACLHSCKYADLIGFINEHETLIENPDQDFISSEYAKLVQSVLGNNFAKYQKLENRLTKILKTHHGTKWEQNPPFLALRLWFRSI